jgi:hypothetical protein
MAVRDSNLASDSLHRIQQEHSADKLTIQKQRVALDSLLNELCQKYPKKPEGLPISDRVIGPDGQPSTYAAISGQFQVHFRIVYRHQSKPGAIIEVLRYDWQSAG